MQSRSATSRRLLLAAGVSSLVFGCAPLPREPAVPPDDEGEVTVLGLKNIRYWGDEDTPEMIAIGKDAYDRELAAWRAAGNDGPLPEADFLAVSGGGENGAFGAGLLCGWSETGQRPEFKLVTGISTGALTAPFAFLGPQYDPQLREVYTGLYPSDVLEERSILALLLGDALSSNEPLRRTI